MGFGVNYYLPKESEFMRMESFINSKAAIADGKGSFSIQSIRVDDRPERDEVLVQIKAAGICHTDWDSQSWGQHSV